MQHHRHVLARSDYRHHLINKYIITGCLSTSAVPKGWYIPSPTQAFSPVTRSKTSTSPLPIARHSTGASRHHERNKDTFSRLPNPATRTANTISSDMTNSAVISHRNKQNASQFCAESPQPSPRRVGMNSFVTPCRGSHELVYEILLSAGASNSGREGEQGRVLSLIPARHDTMAETSRCNSSTALSAHDIKSGGTDGSGTDNTAWLTLISPAHEAESHFWTHGQHSACILMVHFNHDESGMLRIPLFSLLLTLSVSLSCFVIGLQH